ncbi:17247_t:CDS:1, partial [Cetraspora pellucida]
NDDDLIKEICNGLRPTFAREIPQIYVELANHCMSANIPERPLASDLQEYLDSWTKKSFYIKIFNDANINIDIAKHEPESLNDCVNTMSSYQFIKRLIDPNFTNLKDFSKDSTLQNEDLIILDLN